MTASIGRFASSFGNDPLTETVDDMGGSASHDQNWDSVESYFECITTCSLDDGACITHCVEQLREHH